MDDLRAPHPDDACGCADGVLVGQTYGFVEPPEGAIEVQRCDNCQTFDGDESAAKFLAEKWGTGWGWAEAEDYDDLPGDYWVMTKSDQRHT